MSRFLLYVWMCLISPIVSILTAEYDQVKPIPVPAYQERKLKLWQPTIKFDNPCHNYPAVDANGVLSQGNAPANCGSGASNQAYVRLFRVGTDRVKMKAYMYTFFTPTPAFNQDSSTSAGHWYSVVVFMAGQWNGLVAGVAYTSRGYWFPGSKPYGSDDELNLYFTLSVEGLRQGKKADGGVKTDLISWYWVPWAARTALESYGFGPDMTHACPLGKDHFRRNIFEAAVQTRLWPGLTFEMLENFDTAEGRGSI